MNNKIINKKQSGTMETLVTDGVIPSRHNKNKNKNKNK
jgi:hypothetical protein